MWMMMLNIFSCTYLTSLFLLGEVHILVLCLFFNSFVCLSVEFGDFLVHFWYMVFTGYVVCNSPPTTTPAVCSLLFHSLNCVFYAAEIFKFCNVHFFVLCFESDLQILRSFGLCMWLSWKAHLYLTCTMMRLVVFSHINMQFRKDYD